MKIKNLALLILFIFSVALFGCSNPSSQNSSSTSSSSKQSSSLDKSSSSEKSSSSSSPQSSSSEEEITIMVAAAASLEYSYKEKLIPMFEEKYPNIKVEGTYDSSGKLQTQIEEGLYADVFMSAATKQMNALKDKNLVDSNSIVPLLKNKIVLITQTDSSTQISSFNDIGKANTIALGDPESVPVGQYAKESLTSIGVYDKILDKISFGTNVTEVLNWVAEKSADVGIVYSTDAKTNDKVKVIAESPEGSLKEEVIYPVGIVTSSKNSDAAEKFVNFLSTKEALQVFEDYGFTPNDL